MAKPDVGRGAGEGLRDDHWGDLRLGQKGYHGLGAEERGQVGPR